MFALSGVVVGCQNKPVSYAFLTKGLKIYNGINNEGVKIDVIHQIGVNIWALVKSDSKISAFFKHQSPKAAEANFLAFWSGSDFVNVSLPDHPYLFHYAPEAKVEYSVMFHNDKAPANNMLVYVFNKYSADLEKSKVIKTALFLNQNYYLSNTIQPVDALHGDFSKLQAPDIKFKIFPQPSKQLTPEAFTKIMIKEVWSKFIKPLPKIQQQQFETGETYTNLPFSLSYFSNTTSQPIGLINNPTTPFESQKYNTFWTYCQNLGTQKIAYQINISLTNNPHMKRFEKFFHLRAVDLKYQGYILLPSKD